MKSESLVGERIRFGSETLTLDARIDTGLGDNYRATGGRGKQYFVKFQTEVHGFGEDVMITDVVREYEALQHLKKSGRNPHVLTECRIALWNDDGCSVPCIALPYVEGKDLKAILRREEKLLIGTAVAYSTQICDGLEYIHRAGTIHRDIKPANILLSEANGNAFEDRRNVLIVDFGFALMPGEECNGFFYGTMKYVAPEAARRRVGRKSDIYSVGIMLYEMLTGRVPFHHDDEQELLKMHVTCPPPQEPLEEAQVPPGIQNVVLRALEKNPAKRYKTAAEMKEALLEAV